MKKIFCNPSLFLLSLAFVLSMTACQTKEIETTTHQETYSEAEVRELASKVSKFERDEGYPWDHVAQSILKFPDRVENYDRCTDCNSKRIMTYFSSPSETWEMMCGTAGRLIICPICQTQEYYEEVIN